MQEYAALFGVDPIKASQAMKSARQQLPAPDYSLSGSPLWLLETVLAGAEHTVIVSREARRNPGAWQLNEAIAEELRKGLYRGPGSAFKPRARRRSRTGLSCRSGPPLLGSTGLAD